MTGASQRRMETSYSDFAGGLPHSIEAEQGLLGAILINNETYSLVSRLIETRDFYEPIHQRIYGVASDLISAGRLATPVTLKNSSACRFDIAGLSLNQYFARLCTESNNRNQRAGLCHDHSRSSAPTEHDGDCGGIAVDCRGVPC